MVTVAYAIQNDHLWPNNDLKWSLLVGWLVVLRINVDLAIFQPYLDLEAGDNQSLKIQVARPGIESWSSCSASQELNHSATTAPKMIFVITCAGLHNLLPVIWSLYFNKLTKLNIQFLLHSFNFFNTLLYTTVYREFFASGNFGENDAWKVC